MFSERGSTNPAPATPLLNGDRAGWVTGSVCGLAVGVLATGQIMYENVATAIIGSKSLRIMATRSLFDAVSAALMKPDFFEKPGFFACARRHSQHDFQTPVRCVRL